MKDREPISNQPELTAKPDASKLKKEGDIFMPDEVGEGASKPVDTDKPQDRASEGAIPTAAKRGGRRKLSQETPIPTVRADVDIRHKFNSKRQWIGFELSNPTPEAIQQAMEEGLSFMAALTPEQQDAKEYLQAALEKSPKAFAQALLEKAKVFSDEQAQPFVEMQYQNVVDAVRKEAEDTLSKEAFQKIDKSLKDLSKKPTVTDKALGLRSIMTSLKTQQGKATESATPEPVPATPDAAPATAGPAPTPDRLDQDALLTRERAEREAAAEKALGEALSALREAVAKIPDDIMSADQKEAYIRSQDPRVAGEAGIIARQRSFSAEGKDPTIGVPNSMEDLAKLIMKSSEPKWGTGGDPTTGENKELISIDKEGREIVNVINLLDWGRNNLFRVHSANPTSPINFFNDIGTSVRNDQWGSQISFYEIVFTDSIWLDRTIENGKEVTSKNPDYEAVRHQLLMEVFLFSAVRNPDVTWNLTRGQADQMLKALGEASAANPLTRSDFFEFIFTMPSMQRKNLIDFEKGKEGHEMQAKQEGNFYMGDAAREALSAYINISDYNQLVRIFGADSPLFKYDYEDWDLELGERKKDKETGKLSINKTTEADVSKKPIDRGQWFNPDKTVRLGTVSPRTGEWTPSPDGKTGVPHPKFMKYINVFLSPMPDQLEQTEIRTRLILSIMKKNKISFREAQLAELWAYSMTHTTGVAAEMDTEGVSMDYLTRVARLRQKRKREKAEKRSSQYGGKYNLEGFKKIGLTLFEAARDRRGKSIRSIIQGGTGENIGIENTPFKDIVDYERDPASGNIVFRRGTAVAADIVVRNYEIYDEEVEVEIDGEKQKQKHTLMRFLDANGNVVDVKDATATKIVKKGTQVRFNADLQKQFVPNHIITACKIYEFLTKGEGLKLSELVIGRDARRNAILDPKKVAEIKEGIEHDLRYALSTWSEINYDEVDVRAESVEVRDKKGRLLNKAGELLDEDWYVLDKRGRRTQRRSEPHTFTESREITVIESMFGVDALEYIQNEIERRGLTAKQKPRADGVAVLVPIDERGRKGNKNLTLDLTNADDEDFKTAVWQGAFDYLIASEIEAHRDSGSGHARANASMMQDVTDALIVGELATSDRTDFIKRKTGTRMGKLYLEDFSYAGATGGLQGILNMLIATAKNTIRQ